MKTAVLLSALAAMGSVSASPAVSKRATTLPAITVTGNGEP